MSNLTVTVTIVAAFLFIVTAGIRAAFVLSMFPPAAIRIRAWGSNSSGDSARAQTFAEKPPLIKSTDIGILI